MSIQIKLKNFNYNEYTSCISRLAETLVEKHGVEQAQTLAYNIPDSLDKFNEHEAMLFNECENHLLIEKFVELINEDKSEFRAGDLFILADAIDLEEKISKDLYREIANHL